MKRKIFFYIVLIVTTELFSQTNINSWKSEFQNPPKQYYPTPFWHMNGKMTDSEIERQMYDAKLKAKFNGVAVLPVGNTKPDFLSPEFFERYLKNT